MNKIVEKLVDKRNKEYSLSYDGVYLGTKTLYHDNTVIIDIKIDSCILGIASLAISRFVKCTRFENSIGFTCEKDTNLDFLKIIYGIVMQNNSMKKISGCNCIMRYNFSGKNLVLDTEMYGTPYSYGSPVFVINHSKKEVSACHGYFFCGKNVAKKLGYKFVPY